MFADDNRSTIPFMSGDAAMEGTSTIDQDQLDAFFGEKPKTVEDEKPIDTTPAKTPEPAKPKVAEVKKDAQTLQKDVIAAALGEDEDADEDEEESAENQDDTNSDAEEADEKSNVFMTLTQELLTAGIFTLDAEETAEDLIIDNPEDFLNRFQYEGKKTAQAVLEGFLLRFGQEHKDMFDMVMVNGVSPKTYLQRYVEIQDLTGIDLTQESNQERVYRQILNEDGKSSVYIENKINQAKVNGELEIEAKEALPILVERRKAQIEKAKADQADKVRRESEIKDHAKKSIQRILTDRMRIKEFDGIPVTETFAKETYNYILNDKYTVDDKTITEFDNDILSLKRPENYEMRVKIAMLMQMLKKDPTLKTLQRAAVTKEANPLFGALARQGKTAKKSTEQIQQKNTKKDADGNVSSWFK